MHDLKIADLCFVLWVQYNAPRDLAARFLDCGTASVRKRSTRALTKEKYMVFDILSFRNCLCGYDMIQVTVGFIIWARPCRIFGTVREFGFLYCYLTGAGFHTPIPAKKAEKEIACPDEAPSAQSFS